MKSALLTRGLLICVCVVVPLASSQTPAGDPMAGTWKMNVARSSFVPGPAPRSVTYRYENRSDGFTLWISSGENASGNPTFSYSLRKYDGQEYPVYNVATMTAFATTGARPGQTQSARLVDAYTTEVVNKNDGRVTTTVRRTMARDGKSFTMRTTGTNAAGERVDDTTIWERVDGR
jgi:hypothetical protein